MAEKSQLWVFNAAHGTATYIPRAVRASSEKAALEMARDWCVKNNRRPTAQVSLFIVADETSFVPHKSEPEPLPDAITATTK